MPKNHPQINGDFREEAAHDYVVYEADYQSTAWSRRCVRQADLVLIVANANGSPALSPIETTVLAHAENQQIIQCLVLLHGEESDLPQNTMAWLAPRNLRHHYHVRLPRMADFRRLGRLLTEQGVGLVLSGGGARAMAHIGVIHALVEKGIPIDAVCGTSGGALFGGLYAMGRVLCFMERQPTERAYRGSGPLGQPALFSLSSGRRTKRRHFQLLCV